MCITIAENGLTALNLRVNVIKVHITILKCKQFMNTTKKHWEIEGNIKKLNMPELLSEIISF